MRFTGRATARVLALVVALAFLPVLTATSSSAGVTVVPTTFRCLTTAYAGTPLEATFDGGADAYDVRIDAPASVEEGSTAVLRWTMDPDAFRLPFDVTGLRTVTTMRLEVSVNDGTPIELSASGAETDTTDVDAGDPIAMTRKLQTVLPITQVDGDVIEVRPGSFTVEFVAADDDLEGSTTVCTPDEVPAGAATIQVNEPAPIDPSNPCNVVTGACVVGTPGEDYTADELSQEILVDGLNPDAGTIALGSVASSTNSTNLTGALNRTRVTDLRAGAFGWSLTARLEAPFESDLGGSIPASALSIDGLSCDQTAGAYGSAPSSAGGGGSLDEDVTLCTVDLGAIGSGGTGAGQYDVRGTLDLDVPRFAQAGQYTAILVVNLA